ncbi:MAG: acyl-CoA dehydrogenase family protein [Myxococcota bacterium]
MDFNHSRDVVQINEALLRFLKEEVLPLEERHKAETWEGRFSPAILELGAEIRRKSVQLGYYTLHMPEAMGGGGVGHVAMTAFRETIATSGSRILGIFVLGDPPMGPTMMLARCSTYLQDTYLDPLMTGDKTTCFALSEPSAGSDVGAMRTRAVRKGDRYVVNGQKHFISNGPYCDFAQVFVMTDPSKGLGGGCSLLLIDSDTPGFTRRLQQSMMDDDFQAEFFFDDCEVPVENLVGTEGFGFVEAMKWLACERLIVAIDAVGLADQLVRLGVEYASTREQFGRPIGKNQAIQWMLAESATEIDAARWMIYHSAWLVDQGKDAMKEISMAKLFASEMAFRVADRVLQVHGGVGYMKEFPIERLFRVARLLRIGGGTSEIQKLVIAKSLGL